MPDQGQPPEDPAVRKWLDGESFDMRNPNPPPEQPPYGPPADWRPSPPPPPRRPGRLSPSSRRVIIALAGLAALLGLAAFINLAAPSDPAVRPAATNPPTAAPPDQATPTTEAPAPEPVYDVPSRHDFELVVNETGREHFGSKADGIGDNVEYTLELTQVADKTYDPAKQYRLKYRITGSDDGPQEDSLIIQGDTYEQPGEDIASTPWGGKITARILWVREA